MYPILKRVGTMLTIITLLITASAAQAKESKSGPSDGEIAHIVVTANAIDVEAGKLAKAKTKNAEVKKFAQQMITDHTAVNKQAADLAKKLGVTPQSNEASVGLRRGADENVAALKKLKGKNFDREYVNHEVAYHQAVLDTIDQTLIPNAKNEELKGMIEKVRPAIQAHLEHAKHLQSSMSGA